MFKQVNRAISWLEQQQFLAEKFTFRKSSTYTYAISETIVYQIYLSQYNSGIEFYYPIDDEHIRESNQIDFKEFNLQYLRLISKFKSYKSNLNDLL